MALNLISKKDKKLKSIARIGHSPSLSSNKMIAASDGNLHIYQIEHPQKIVTSQKTKIIALTNKHQYSCSTN